MQGIKPLSLDLVSVVQPVADVAVLELTLQGSLLRYHVKFNGDVVAPFVSCALLYVGSAAQGL